MREEKIYDDLYMLRNPFTERIKIGRTTNFKKRLRNLITSGGIPEMEVISLIEKCGDFEKYMLKVFSKYNIVGEWFHESEILDLFITSIKEYEDNTVPFEELVIRFSILENEFSESKEFLKLKKFSDIVTLTNPLYKSAQKKLDQIKKERKGIGWGVQTSFLDFIYFKKIDFRNFKYSINTFDKLQYKLIKSPNFDVNNPKHHIKIEILKMKKNNTIKWKQKEIIQEEIDKLFEEINYNN